MAHGIAPGHAAAHRIAAQHKALQAQPVHQLLDDADIGGVAVVARRGRAGQAMRRQIEADHPVALGGQPLGPGFPRVQRRVGAVHQHDRKARARAFVAHVDGGAGRQFDKLAGGIGIFGAQLGGRNIRGGKHGDGKGEQPHDHRQHDQQAPQPAARATRCTPGRSICHYSASIRTGRPFLGLGIGNIVKSLSTLPSGVSATMRWCSRRANSTSFTCI